MPQMAPMNWISLYMYFLMMYIITTIIIYYMFVYFPKQKMMNKYQTKVLWKW
uniref:ATP synthase F0 subunit 8 n=1 Tax=Setarhynchus sp. AH-2016 TaxID=1903834 RepID=A0A343C582_9CUCU|nr:ATP synthase F0 subunit 8 [Setarhynchus sp. AH-2016]